MPRDEAALGADLQRDLAIELAETRQALTDANEALRGSELARTEAIERASALQRELQHRTRNMLASIRTVFRRTVEATDSLQEAADHFAGRLDVLGRYQNLPSGSKTRTVDLETLIRDELLIFGNQEECVTLAGPTTTLSLEAAQLIGMAMHELATNSVKFGVLGAKQGRLAVTWSCDDAEQQELAIEWLETGVPVLASAPRKVGFGRDFIENGLPYQLNATTSFELRPGGLFCRISFLNIPLGAQP